MPEKSARLLEALKRRKLTLASAESLTGGLFGATLCQVPGASEAYRGGVIAYQKQLKQRLLGVDAKTIEEHSVVSAEVAAEMAEGCLRATQSDIAISCTGNAGPGAEKGGKAVGCVYLGLADRANLSTKELSLSGSREQIRQQTVEAMIDLLLSNLS